MNQNDRKKTKQRESSESYYFSNLQSIEWWEKQFTKTHNCTPGGVFLIFGGALPLSSLAAAWFVAAWCIRKKEDGSAFSKIIHIVPPQLGPRDVRAEICTSIKTVLATEGQPEESQELASKECASRFEITSNGDEIIRKLKDLPDFSAISISCSDRVRYADINADRENVVTTHTGLRLNFATDDEIIFPHLYKLLEGLIQLTSERQFSVVVLVEKFIAVHFPIPEKIVSAANLAIINATRSKQNKSNLSHLIKALEIRKSVGIQPAIAYLEQSIPDAVNRALTIAAILERDQLFAAAWCKLLPHLEAIRKNSSGQIILNSATAATAVGATKEAVSLLEAAWHAGLEDIETVNSAALIARKLNAEDIWQKIIEAMTLNYPEHPSALARHYEWLYENGLFKQASVIAQKLGNEFEVTLCEFNCAANPNWDVFVKLGAAVGRKDEALLIATSQALKTGDVKLANRFITSVSSNVEVAADRIRLLIKILSKNMATTQEGVLEPVDDTLTEVFEYVATHPADTKTRFDLVEMFEVSLQDGPAIILLSKRCVDTFTRWLERSSNDTIDFESEPLSSVESVNSSESALAFMQALYHEAQPSVICLGKLPATYNGHLNTDLLFQLGQLMCFAGHKADAEQMIGTLHAIGIACRELENPNSDYIAGMHTMGVLVSAGKVQDALNLGETMLAFWPMSQPKFEVLRMSHGWAAMSDAYLRSQNPITALLCICLSFEAMSQTLQKQQIALLRHKLRLAARIFRDMRLASIGQRFLKMERQFVELLSVENRQFRELTVLELSYDLSELTSETPIPILMTLLDRTIKLLLDDRETEWEPIAACAASVFSECQRRGVSVSADSRNLLFSRVGRCRPLVQNRIRRHLLARPKLVDVEAALRDLQGAARFDDQGFQLAGLEDFLRRAISVACDSNDADLFLAAATLLSQPALAAAQPRNGWNVRLNLKAPNILSAANGFETSERLADFAAATHVSSVANEIRFSELSLWPLSAVRFMASIGETICVLAYDSSRHLCQLLVSRDKIDGPKRLSQTMWNSAKHLKWSRCFPEHYAWKQEVNFGIVDERPKMEAVKASLKNLGIDVTNDTQVLTFVPESELFGFPFVITESNGSHLAEKARCSTVPSLSWLGNIKQTEQRNKGQIEAWLGSPTKSPFDVLKVRDGLLPAIMNHGGKVLDSDTPESLAKADVAIVLSHGSRNLWSGFSGISEEFGKFTSEELANWFRDCQCVILFVCHAGRSDDRLHSQETFGLVARLLRRQVRLIIAPPWPLNTDIPQIWLPAFLSTLLSGDNAGIAAANAAQVVRARFSHPCAWGAMQLFGDAEFRLNLLHNQKNES